MGVGCGDWLRGQPRTAARGGAQAFGGSATWVGRRRWGAFCGVKTHCTFAGVRRSAGDPQGRPRPWQDVLQSYCIRRRANWGFRSGVRTAGRVHGRMCSSYSGAPVGPSAVLGFAVRSAGSSCVPARRHDFVHCCRRLRRYTCAPPRWFALQESTGAGWHALEHAPCRRYWCRGLGPSARLPRILLAWVLGQRFARGGGTHAGSGTGRAHARRALCKEISIRFVQRAAAAACRDGLRAASLLALASLGTNGANPQNCERDFHARLGKGKLGFNLEPWYIPVPHLVRDGVTVETLPFPVLAPHELFATIFGQPTQNYSLLSAQRT